MIGRITKKAHSKWYFIAIYPEFLLFVIEYLIYYKYLMIHTCVDVIYIILCNFSTYQNH